MRAHYTMNDLGNRLEPGKDLGYILMTTGKLGLY